MELILHLVILAISLILFGFTFLFNGLNINTGGGPSFWPQILLVLIIVLELVVLVFTYKKYKNGELKRKKDESVIYPQNLYISIVSLTLYIVLMQYIGFLISTVIYLCFMMHILQVKLKTYLIISLLSGYIITFVFGNLLMVPLPQGISIFRIISQTLGA
ncbi:MAG: tripartite tricarboxylate transporter TctB family protein [Sedimentibacter sp.]